MSSEYNKAIRDFANTLKNIPNSKTSPYDIRATVTRIDGTTAWVSIPGGVSETPVQLTTNAKKGDIVQVRISGGSAWITGNATSPPTDDTKAIQADEKAEKVQIVAIDAKELAESANEFAGQAKNAADRAEESADAAQMSANDADISAKQAIDSANIANESANSAILGLEEIEKVVDVVNWIAEHGQYSPATETTTIEGKYYFSYDSTTDKYTAVTPVCNPSLQSYYELSSGTFTLSTDEIIINNKYYYKRIGNSSPYTYKIVIPDEDDESPVTEGWYELSDPTYAASTDTTVDEDKQYYSLSDGSYIPLTETPANPAALGLYILDSVDESISNYVASHVVLIDDGLIIQTDGIDSKVKISGQGVSLVNNSNKTIATFSTNITLGDANSVHVVLTPSALEFWNGSNKVSWVSSDTLHIAKSEIETSLRIGQFLWKVQSANRISLVYDPV